MKPDYNITEQDIRSDFRTRWRGWLESYQPGLGGGMGIPDIQIMAQPPWIVPIEIKRGLIIDGRLFADKIRPDQVSWHTRFAIAKGISWFYIGAKKHGELRRFLVESYLVLAMREQGIPIDNRHVHEVLVADDQSINRSVTAILTGNN